MLSGHSINHSCCIIFFLLKRNKKHHLKVLIFFYNQTLFSIGLDIHVFLRNIYA
ncbi:hypothetical protein [Chlamydia felis Fe/C-56]|uniref:Uncharacterized protein n=1 Tax=Chlamydia felis (strain Fe/C-56) TaxID=264202 RepID=Q255U0_CHLFF|nr:hypothetical protein [Chlamydia felis Fe/C-56]